MSKNFNLTVYQISINIRREKEKKEVLSDFFGGNDLLNYIYDILKTWKYSIKTLANPEQPKTPLLQKDTENERVFRIMKQDNQDQLFYYGRYISGIIESGDYGTEENIVNILTGESSHTKKTTESVLFPFYFMFYIPENSNSGFLILERIGNNGIYSLLDKKLKEYIVPRISNECVLKIRPLVLNKLVEKHLQYINGGAKKIIFEKVVKEDLKVSKMTEGNIEDKQVDNVEIVYSAIRNHPFSISNWFNKIKRVENTVFYVVADVQYKDISFEISVNGSNRKVSINDIAKLGTFMDVTDKVVLASNKYPTYFSIDKEAHFLVSYINEQFKNDYEEEKK